MPLYEYTCESCDKTFQPVYRGKQDMRKERMLLCRDTQFTHRDSACTNRDMYFYISIVSTFRMSSGACRLLNFR